MEEYYKAYFANLVSVSNHLVAFYYINDRYNMDAFDNAVKSVGQTPALLLEQYDYETGDTGTRNYRKTLQGQFNILVKTIKGNQASIESAHSFGEQIADMVIARMWNDFSGGGTITNPDDNTVSGTIFFNRAKAKVQAIGPVNADYYGVSCVFNWETPVTMQVSSDDWSDI